MKKAPAKSKTKAVVKVKAGSPALRQPRPVAGAGAITQAKAVRVIERRFQVVSLRRDGHSIREIADSLGISDDAVQKDLQLVLGRAAKETNLTAEEARQLELERLDSLYKEYSPLAYSHDVEVDDKDRPGQKKIVRVGGSGKAAELLLAISDRRRKLEALDKPEQKWAAETGVRVYIGVNVEDV